ncbi:MAG: hypothetical protein LAN62_04915 [Acidobacteriia bacterium]|nr:hypothetical protein [Terriglobia bacterium]
MWKARFFFTVGLVCLLALPLLAQEKPGNVATATYVKPKPGMRQQFEQANKRHMEWHRQQKDTWTINVWEVISGEHIGQYGYATVGHHWKDFDARAKFDEADMADYMANVAQYVDLESNTYWIHHPDQSRPLPGDAPIQLYEAVRYHLNVDGESDFLLTGRKILEAIQKTNYPVYYEAYELWDGGEHPTYLLIFPHKNWADFEPPEQTFPAMLEKAFGRDEAESLMKLSSKSIHCVHSEVWVARPDLGYVPPAAK